MYKLPHIYPTVVHMLVAAAEQAPQHEALVQGELRLDYEQYLRCVIGFAEELRQLGAGGERVALVMGNSINICIAMFAIHMVRAQAVPLNPVYTEQELHPMLEDAEVQVLIHDEALGDKLKGIADELNITHRISCGGEHGRDLSDWKDDDSLLLPDNLPEPDLPSTLQFTGGTTGRSKGAELTHKSLSVNISQREAVAPARIEQERMLCVMPLFHCYAVSMCLHNMVYCRGTLVVMPRYHPQEVLEAIEKERITIFGGSPTLFSGLLNYEGFENTDFSSLHLSYSGSAPLAEELINKWEAVTGTFILEGYGQSEASPVITYTPLNGERKLTAVGIPLPETELQIVDLQDGVSVLPAGEQGEIRLRGPQVMLGYRNREEETKKTLKDGWLYTGDIGLLDEDNYLFITGRKKEMIIVSGFNVFPREIEELLYQYPAVKEVAVVGKADDYRGELPVAFVVTETNDSTMNEKLKEYCQQNLAPYKVPAEIRIVEALPKTAVGKINKLALAELI